MLQTVLQETRTKTRPPLPTHWRTTFFHPLKVKERPGGDIPRDREGRARDGQGAVLHRVGGELVDRHADRNGYFGGEVHGRAIEMNAPQNLVRQGWKRTTLKTGDKVSVVVHPLRDGKPGGSYVSIQLANGTKLGGSGPGQSE